MYEYVPYEFTYQYFFDTHSCYFYCLLSWLNSLSISKLCLPSYKEQIFTLSFIFGLAGHSFHLAWKVMLLCKDQFSFGWPRPRQELGGGAFSATADITVFKCYTVITHLYCSHSYQLMTANLIQGDRKDGNIKFRVIFSCSDPT